MLQIYIQTLQLLTSIHLSVQTGGRVKHAHSIRFIWHEVGEPAHLVTGWGVWITMTSRINARARASRLQCNENLEVRIDFHVFNGSDFL